MYICKELASFGSKLAYSDLSEDTLYHAKRALIDWYAALIAGYETDITQILIKASADDIDRGDAHLALGRPATARSAALINGTAAHAAEVDDIYREAIYHPGAPTISAALAAAEKAKKNGLELLRAIIVGYEISTRIGRSMGRAHYQYWHNTGTVGSFGSAAAVGALLNLPAQSLAHALATVATFAAGLQGAFQMDSMSKPLHSGRAAEAGLLAANLAANGGTGALDVLESDLGFGAAMSKNVDWGAALQDLGEQFLIESMTFKNHACCGHTFAAIDGALALKNEYSIDPQEISHIRIGSYQPALEVAGNSNPKTAAEARFSIPFVVATALLHESVRLSAFSVPRLADQNIRDLMKKITLYVETACDDKFPAQRSALVTIELKNGKKLQKLQPTRKGDPDLPLTDQELNDKFIELVSPILGTIRARDKLDLLWALDEKATAQDILSY